jgi:hypothetical protein
MSNGSSQTAICLADGTGGCAVLNLPNIFTQNGAASTPPIKLNGSWYTGGSGTTTQPQFLIEPSGTSSVYWNTSGTALGIDAPSSFAGNLIDAKFNGISQFKVDYGGDISGRTLALIYCVSNASPALCGGSSTGFVSIPAGSTTLTIDTTAVTSYSQIIMQGDESIGAALGVTCNTTLTSLINPVVTARVPGTSFSVATSATIAVNPACYSYMIIN